MDPESMASTPLPLVEEMDVEVLIDYTEQDGDIVIDEADAEMVFEATAQEGMLEEAEMDDAVVWEEPSEEIMVEEQPEEIPGADESIAEIAPFESALAVEESAVVVDVEPTMEVLDVPIEEAVEVPVETEIAPAETEQLPVDVSAPLPLPSIEISDTAVPTPTVPETLVEVASEEVDVPANSSAKGKGRAHESTLVEPTLECSCSLASSLTRPVLKKALLDFVNCDGQDSTTSSSIPSTSTQAVPSVYVTHNNASYSLFQRYVGDLETDRETSEARPLLFGAVEEQDLYYASVEKFIEAIHRVLPDFQSSAVELVLTFPEIGISLTEDSVYTRQVSLYDFYRTHVGCGLTGSLSIALEVQPRFANDFNALMEHIEHQRLAPTTAEITEAIDEEAGEEVHEETYENGVEENQDFAEVHLADDEHSVLGEDDREERSETYEVIDAELAAEEGGELYEAEEEWAHEEHGAGEAVEGGLGQESYELEEVLAEMDSDDLAALVDGAIEDVSAFSESDQLAMLEEMRGDGENDELAGGEDFGEGEVEGKDAIAGDDGADDVDIGDGVESAALSGATDEVAAVEVEVENAQAENGNILSESFVVVEQEDAAVDVSAAQTLDTPPTDYLPPKIPSTLPSYNFSYDSPTGTGREPPSIPLSVGSEAIVDAVKENAAHVVVELAVAPENVDIASLPLPDITHVIADSSEVVIDYEEPFEPASHSTIPLDTVVPVAGDIGQPGDDAAAPRSPKRTRAEAELPLSDDSSTVDTKRLRLDEAVPTL